MTSSDNGSIDQNNDNGIAKITLGVAEPIAKDTSNDNAALVVGEATDNSDSGSNGGGAISWFYLMMLLGLAVLGRRYANYRTTTY